MTREEAIREIKNMAKFNYTLAPIEVFDMAIKALEDSRWIPVTERLPEEDGDYLVTTSSLYGVTKYVTTRDFSEGRWTCDSAVTAWMPLQKPYEGESRIVTDDRWVVSVDGTLNDMWMKRIEAIKDEIHRYWLNCDFAVDDKVCKECGKNVFGSILRIIDKHTKGEQ